jgi:hypothetical protein
LVMVGEEFNSILAADIGRQWTKVLLLERVEGVFRFVTRGQAPTSLVGLPEADGILAGLRAAIRQIEQVTGRVLLRGDDLVTPEDSDGNGVDSLVATTSAAPDLRVVIAGLIERCDLEAARDAARTTYCDVRATVSANGGLSRGLPRRWFGTGTGGLDSLEHELSAQAPDVVVLVGGSDGGSAVPLAEAARSIAASGFPESAGRSVVFAGNAGAQADVIRSLSNDASLRVVDNVAPARGVRNPEPLARELDAIFRERKVSSIPGRAALETWGVRGIETGAGGFWLVLRFLAQHYGLRVLGVDVGAETTLMGFATQSGLTRGVWPGAGAGESLARLLDSVGAASIARWAPFPCSEDHLLDYVSRRQAQPLATPVTTEQSLLELAFVREAMRALPVASAADLILGCGGALGHVRRPGLAALAMLDGLQPCGVCQLTLDSSLAASALGAVALTHPEAAAQVLLGDALLPLGTAVCPSGTGRRGKTALTIRIRSANSDGADPTGEEASDLATEVCAEVPFGQLSVIPAVPGKRIRLELRPARGFDVGLGNGAAAGLDLVPQGLGIIVDCRGRPFAPPTDADDRLLAVQDWNRALGALD